MTYLLMLLEGDLPWWLWAVATLILLTAWYHWYFSNKRRIYRTFGLYDPKEVPATVLELANLYGVKPILSIVDQIRLLPSRVKPAIDVKGSLDLSRIRQIARAVLVFGLSDIRHEINSSTDILDQNLWVKGLQKRRGQLREPYKELVHHEASGYWHTPAQGTWIDPPEDVWRDVPAHGAIETIDPDRDVRRLIDVGIVALTNSPEKSDEESK